ncbi:MAG TPA: hypothetical protein VK989_07485 [Polyangia bacterium]|jgi:hypothetical protein|nr:hypothetical protein [Polyangia bacterium]
MKISPLVAASAVLMVGVMALCARRKPSPRALAAAMNRSAGSSRDSRSSRRWSAIS